MLCVRLFCREIFLYGFLVVCRSLALRERDRPRRTSRQAVAEPVAVIVAEKLGLAIGVKPDRSLVARVHARPASVAFFFVYVNYSSYHRFSPSFFVYVVIITHSPIEIRCGDNKKSTFSPEKYFCAEKGHPEM